MAEIIRVEKNKNFTVMANYHLREKGLSLKAKGLMSYILSLPDDWDYTIEGLALMSYDGVTAITSAMKELEKFGYVERRGRERDEKGRLRGSCIIIHEVPISIRGETCVGDSDYGNSDDNENPPPETENECLDTCVQNDEFVENIEKYDDGGGENDTENPISENLRQANSFMVTGSTENPISENLRQEKPISENPVLEKQGQLNTNNINTNNINTNILNQGAHEAAPNTEQESENYRKGLYFPDSKRLSDAFRDFVYMRRRKGGGVMTDRAISLTKDWLRQVASENGEFDEERAIDILNYATMNSESKLKRPEERNGYNKKPKPNSQELAERSPSYEGRSEEDLEKMFLAN